MIVSLSFVTAQTKHQQPQHSEGPVRSMVAKEGIIADADARYTFDETKLAELRKSSPWKDDPRYFQSVAIGPSAVMIILKML